MMKQSNIPLGVAVTLVVALVSFYLSSWLGTTVLQYIVSPISTVLVAVLIGIALRTFFSLPKQMDAGLEFTSKYILRLGIILLGIRLSFYEFVEFGLFSIPLIITCFLSVLMVIRMCIHFFPISKNMSYLIGIGTAICGVTAIVATSPVIQAKKEEVAYAIANITLFGIFAMLVYPFVAHWLFPESNLAIGLFLGTALHDTTQATGAALIYSEQFGNSEVVNVTVVTKLIRNTFLIILIPLIAMMHRGNKKNSTSFSLSSIFPYFVLGFVAMVILRTLGDSMIGTSSFISKEAWTTIIAVLKNISEISLTMAMAAMGLLTYVSKLKALGAKPFIVGFVSALTVGFVSLTYIHLFIL